MAEVFAVCRLLDADTGAWELNGVFSSREAAQAVAATEADSVVTFELDRDYTAERTFEIAHPALGIPPRQVTA